MAFALDRAVDVAAGPSVAHGRGRYVLRGAGRELAQKTARTVPARRTEDLTGLGVNHREMPASSRDGDVCQAPFLLELFSLTGVSSLVGEHLLFHAGQEDALKLQA